MEILTRRNLLRDALQDTELPCGRHGVRSARLREVDPRRFEISRLDLGRVCRGAAICALAIGFAFATSSAARAQASGNRAQSTPNTLSPQDVEATSKAMAAFGKLIEQWKKEVQLPPERTESRLLPLLPESTVFYGALGNYGEAAHQALAVFRREREQNPELREWWQKAEKDGEASKFEDFIEKYYEISQYLGDEAVAAAWTAEGSKSPSFVLLTEIRKPGLKELLQKLTPEFAGKSVASIRIVDPEELARAKDGDEKKLAILVRPDFLVAAFDISTLRFFNEQLDRKSQEFASTPFGARILEAYAGGTSALAAADVQKLIALIPSNADKNQAAKNQEMLKRSGFGDAKYLVWQHRTVSGRAASEVELSFTGPRHGVASWLAAPGPMESLEFISPAAAIAVGILLKSPAEIYDDVRDLAQATNPNAFAMQSAMEQQLKLSVRDDLLGQLTGQIAFELDSIGTSEAVWKTIWGVKNPERLQATFDKLLAMQHMGIQQSEQDGIIYYTVQVPSAQKKNEFAYAFVDGYLVAGSSRDSVSEAIGRHKSGDSITKSPQFTASLPPSPHAEVSGLFYEDAAAMLAMGMRQAQPDLAKLFAQASTERNPAVAFAYGEESAIRETSMSAGFDVGAMAAVSAIAIPNLIRARGAANEGTAAASIRTVNVAQVTYSATYPERGFARDLASLGPDPAGVNKTSAEHASIIDKTLGGSECTAGKWCTKAGFQFTIKALCVAQQCTEYTVLATPVDSNAGTRSFCSTSDGVVRVKVGPAPSAPISAAECRRWPRLQ